VLSALWTALASLVAVLGPLPAHSELPTNIDAQDLFGQLFRTNPLTIFGHVVTSRQAIEGEELKPYLVEGEELKPDLVEGKDARARGK
jgi:hypothetical protein